jgi:hypothetical protein
VINPSACDHQPLGTAVRSAKPQGYFLDFRRTDRHAEIGSAEAATLFVFRHENPQEGRNFCLCLRSQPCNSSGSELYVADRALRQVFLASH